MADAGLYAPRDKDTRPVDSLHQAAEEGWTYSRWWLLDHSPHLERLRALLELGKIRADFAARATLGCIACRSLVPSINQRKESAFG